MLLQHKPRRSPPPSPRRRSALAAWAALDPARGGIATLLAALAVVAAGFAWLEGGTVSARDLTLVATLGGIAAAGRVLFTPVPSVQPVTVIVAAAGVALGPRRGFAVGALAAIASNFFLGQGPHTPWQMLAWGGCGLLAGLLRPLLRQRFAFAAFTLLLGLAFGTVMDLWLWYGFYPHTEAALLARLGAGLPFNIAHAAGNVVLAARRRPGAETRARTVRAPVADGGRVGVKLLAVLAVTTALASPAAYLQAHQREDGSFGDAQITAWATLALVAAGAETGDAAVYLGRQSSGERHGCRSGRDGARRSRRPARRPAPTTACAPAGASS